MSSNTEVGKMRAVETAVEAQPTQAGSVFVLEKEITSSAITFGAAIDLTGVSTGLILIENIIIQSDATGLAAMTLFQILTNNVKGLLAFFATSVASLGANLTVNMDNATSAKVRTVLEAGKKLTYKATVADGTGSGKIKVYVVCRRLTDGASLSLAS